MLNQCMHGWWTSCLCVCTLLFGSDVDKTERWVRKAIPEVREVQIPVVVPLLHLSYFWFDEEMGGVERITVGDYGRLDNFDEVAQGFKQANPILFDIKTDVLAFLKEN